MLWTMAPRTAKSFELRVFSVTARQAVKVLSAISYSPRWNCSFASVSRFHSSWLRVSFLTVAPICAWYLVTRENSFSDT